MADEPVTAFRSAVADYEVFVKEHPEEPKYLEGLARSRTDLGNALAVLERLSEAESQYREAILDYRKLIERESTEDTSSAMRYREGIAGTYSKLGRVLSAAGRGNDARESYRVSFQEYQRLSRSSPESLDLLAREPCPACPVSGRRCRGRGNCSCPRRSGLTRPQGTSTTRWRDHPRAS